jgi:hypothetical protein
MDRHKQIHRQTTDDCISLLLFIQNKDNTLQRVLIEGKVNMQIGYNWSMGLKGGLCEGLHGIVY